MFSDIRFYMNPNIINHASLIGHLACVQDLVIILFCRFSKQVKCEYCL